MKYIKTFEGLLKGKSEERLLNDLTETELIEFCIKNELFDKLPRNKYGICVYQGNLNLNHIGLKSLPNNLRINGDIFINNNLIIKLPQHLIVNGYLDCEFNLLKILPNDLKVKRGINCSFNQLTSLPDNLTLDGDLLCNDNNLTYLPENLTINGNIDCRHQEYGIILKLPKSAKIKGHFFNY